MIAAFARSAACSKPGKASTTSTIAGDDVHSEYLSSHDAWKDFDSGLVFSKIDLVCNSTPVDKTVGVLEPLTHDPNTAEIMDLFTPRAILLAVLLALTSPITRNGSIRPSAGLPSTATSRCSSTKGSWRSRVKPFGQPLQRLEGFGQKSIVNRQKDRSFPPAGRV